MKFPERVRYLREKKGLTQEELARLTNVSQVSIHAYEAGKVKPFRNTQIQLAKHLGVTVNELMKEEDNEQYQTAD